MRRTVSPEFSLVAATAMAPDAALAGRAEALVSPPFDWIRWRDLARHHSVLEIAGDRLERAVPGLVPEAIRGEVRDGMTRNLALHLAQARHTARLVGMLGEAGLRAVVLKGVPLSRRLYPGHPEWRFSSDIDLLIDPRDVPKADEVLRASGHVRTWPEGDMAHLPHAVLSRFAKDYQFHTPDRSHYIELHWRLTHNPHVLAIPFDELYANTVETDPGFGPMRSLAGPVLTAYLAWHALADINHLLKWFADLAWARRMAGEGGADQLAGHLPLLPLAIAAEIEAALSGDPPRRVSPLVARICRDMDRGHRFDTKRTLSRIPREISLTALLMRMAPGLKAKAWFVWRALVDSRDAVTLGGRELPALAYALAGPALAVGRYLRRLAR